MTTTKPQSKLVRNTFGLIDPLSGNRYADILSAHLQARRIQREEYLSENGGKIAESADRQKEYTLLLDHKALKTLLQEGELRAIISFQRRTDGNFAVARIFQAKNKLAATEAKEKDYA